MAVDTRNKRSSVLGIGLTSALTLPLADGAVGQSDRAHVAFSYAGLDSVVAATANYLASYVTSQSLLASTNIVEA